MVDEKLSHFLRNQEFVELATADKDGYPHVSPKVILKVEEKHIYLIDNLEGSSFKNIKENNKVAISTFNIQIVEGYYIYGKASVIEKGPEYKRLLTEWNHRQSQMAAQKVSETVHGTQNIRSLKLTFLKPAEIYKIAIEKVSFLNAEGSLVTEEIK